MKSFLSFYSTAKSFSVCVTTALACSYQSAIAAEAMKDVSKEISDLRSTIVFAELYTVSDDLSFRIGLREQDVVRMGCEYSAVEKNDLAALLDVLTNAQFVQRPEDQHARETRIVVHLHTREGNVIPFALTRQFSSAPVTGTYNHNTPVVAKMEFGDELRRWKVQRKPTKENELMCRD